MRARRGGWRLVGREAATVLLAFALFLQAALPGRGTARAAALAFDPAAVICAAHPHPAGGPDDGDRAPAGPHNSCCILLCGTGGVPPPALLPGSGPALPPPVQLGSARGRSTGAPRRSSRPRGRHGARAPPVRA